MKNVMMMMKKMEKTVKMRLKTDENLIEDIGTLSYEGGKSHREG